MDKGNIFAYSWYLDEKEEEHTCIRIYGINEEHKNICLCVNDFTPYIYIELPNHINWDVGKAQILSNKINEKLNNFSPIDKQLVFKKKLYGAYITSDGKRQLFPYLFCKFNTRKDIKMTMSILRKPFNVVGLGIIKLKIHESDANEILQLTSCRKLPTAGWITFGGKSVHPDNKITHCDYEYSVRWKNLMPLERDNVAHPKIMGFDIEVNSTIPTRMPVAQHPGDKVFQISCVIHRYGETEEQYDKYILTLGDPYEDIVGDDVLIYTYPTESELLLGFIELINDENVNIIAGYNILGFDIPYMIDRAKHNYIISEFDKQGFHKYNHAVEKTIKWSSSAYGTQEFQYLDAEGRIFVDLLPLVKRDFKFSNYKLQTIANYFIGESKDPLDAKGIFKCYRIGMKKDTEGNFTPKARKAMGIVAKYCVQDSVLVCKLMDKLQTWVGLTEMAKTCHVPIFILYTQGQQIKVYSQLYIHCMYENVVVEKDAYQVSENERYVGAHVFPPIPGKYKNVIPFDFSSLYPTTIIAYNIDYHTWVPDNSDIPDELCHVMEWEDHISCQHDPKIIRKMELTKYIDGVKDELSKMRDKKNKTLDKLRKKELTTEIKQKTEELKPYISERSDITKTVNKNPMCAKRYYRFLKEPKGILPTIIQNCLDARKKTRKVDMVSYKDRIKSLQNLQKESGEDKSKEIEDLVRIIGVLDKRQLAYKVSANSMYGAMGVRKGYLPFMPGAMCTTFMGRKNIELVAKTITEKHRGSLVYGDTDTCLATTPVLILKNNIQYYTTLENLSAGDWKKTVTGKEISSPKDGIKVWSDKGFTEIKYVMRHAIEKPMIKVTTHTGTVVCTLDHSLLWENGEPALGSEIKLKDKLCHKDLPLPDDTPEEPVYPNKLTAEKIREYIISDDVYEDLSAELAFVWGVFFADGSCGSYKQQNGVKYNWAINKKDNLLLERCVGILTTHEAQLSFKILDTMKSSHADKLVPCINQNLCKEDRGTIKEFVEKYRELFYDNRKYKKVPDIVLNAPYSIREAFFMGYYAGDGSKKDPALTMTNKGEIGCAGLFFLLRSIGYQVSINTRGDKQDTYKLTGSTPNQGFRYHPNAVKKIESYQTDDEYIYDIETDNHHFAAGIGQMVVHNSNYIHFPHMENKSSVELWDYAEEVAEKVTRLFPPPIKLEFEEAIYSFFFILTKKRYMYRAINSREGEIENKIGKKGVLLARRDNSKFVRDVYEGVISRIADNVSKEDILYWIVGQINDMMIGNKPVEDFIVTKSVGDSGDLIPIKFVNEKDQVKCKLGSYTVPWLSNDPEERETQLAKKGAKDASEYYLLSLPAQVQLAERMKRRGQPVASGSRIEYVIINPDQHTAKQYEKVESADYYKKFKKFIKLDYLYYLKALANPLDQVLNVAYGGDKDWKNDFILNYYKYLWKVKHKFMEEVNSVFKPSIRLE